MSDVINKRIADPPDPQSRLSEAEKWLELLPAPPRPLGEQDEISIALWLREVGAAGGIAGLQWAWDPAHWPFGPYMRGRCTHIHGAAVREIEEEGRRKAEQAARERADKERDQHRELLKAKGWRVTT